MFTKNYDTYRKVMFSGDTSAYGKHPELLTFTELTGAEHGVSDIRMTASGSYQDIGYFLNKAVCGAMETGLRSTANGGIYFGSGSAPATKEDYCLQNPITSGLSITNPSKYTYTEDGNGQKVFSATYVLTNTSDAEINIYEIGAIISAGVLNGTSTAYYRILVERTVLTEPITIPVGESKMVTYKITVNEFLNVE